jgi:hypothetical protein
MPGSRACSNSSNCDVLLSCHFSHPSFSSGSKSSAPVFIGRRVTPPFLAWSQPSRDCSNQETVFFRLPLVPAITEVLSSPAAALCYPSNLPRRSSIQRGTGPMVMAAGLCSRPLASVRPAAASPTVGQAFWLQPVASRGHPTRPAESIGPHRPVSPPAPTPTQARTSSIGRLCH